MPKVIIVDKRKLEYAFVDNAIDSGLANKSTYTFSAFNFGTADPERYIVVGVSTAVAGGELPTSVTIGGVSATHIKSSSLGTNPTMDVWEAFVPTGTSGSVVVNYSSNGTRIVNVSGYSILPVLSLTYSSAKGGATNGASDSINVPATGVALGFSTSNGTGASAWTGLTEDFDQSPTRAFSSASYQSPSGDTGLSVSVAVTGATVNSAVFVVFGP